MDIPTGFTPGPWRWEVNRGSQSVELCGGLPAGMFGKTVMSFKRWGLQRAAPVFWFWCTSRSWSEEPQRADAISVPVAGREHHERWFRDIDHPDARLIALAPEMAAEIARLTAALAEAQERLAVMEGLVGRFLAHDLEMSDGGVDGQEHGTLLRRARAALAPVPTAEDR